jgi:DNA-binding IclR family transcriptional regulator
MPKHLQIETIETSIAILKSIALKGNSTLDSIALDISEEKEETKAYLNILEEAGFIRKINSESYRLDYAALKFADYTLHSLPAANISYKICQHIVQTTNLNASVGILRDRELMCLNQKDVEKGRSFRFLPTLDLPLHATSLGCVLSWSQDKSECIKILKKSFKESNLQDESQKIFDEVDDSMEKYGIYWNTRNKEYKFSAAIQLTLEGEKAAIAVFSREKKWRITKIKSLLDECKEIALTEETPI